MLNDVAKPAELAVQQKQVSQDHVRLRSRSIPENTVIYIVKHSVIRLMVK